MLHCLRDYKFRIINLLILAIIAYYSFAYHRPIFLIFAFSNAILLETVLLFISKYRRLFILISFFISLIIGIEVTYVTVYSCRISFGIIASTFETNLNETQNMLISLAKYIPLFVSTVVIVFLSMLFAGKEQVKVPIKKIYILLAFIVALLPISVKSYRYVTSSDYFYTVVKGEFQNYPIMASNEYFFHWTPSFFYTSIFTLSYLNEQYKFKKAISIEQTFPKEICNSTEQREKPNTIFIVIGESSNRDHYSLYGYDAPTTPHLDSLCSQKKLLYYKAYSPASITRDAVPFFLTFGTPFDPFLQNTEEGIISLAKNLGYDTYWISNQDKIGMHESSIGYIATRCKSSFFPKDVDDNSRDDIELIDKVKEIYSSQKKQVFILHLRGSHQFYKNGYDNTDVEKFDVSGCSPGGLDYDRTIHHTDRLLGELYTEFFQTEENESLNSMLFYTSDHGEIVNVGHGLANTNLDQFKIPFIVFGSSYFEDIDNLIDKYTKDSIFNSSNFPYIFSEIIGYDVKEEYVEKAKNEGLYYQSVDRKILQFEEEQTK